MSGPSSSGSPQPAFRGLRLTNTLTREKEDFVPIDPDNVRMYVCGPTVYDFAHIGNARPVIVFDVLFRLLRHLYGEAHVTYVRNITDVDDKINARALRDFPDLPLNEAIRRVTEKTAGHFHKDVAALGCLPPSFEPRATEFVEPRADGKTDMIGLIQALIERGHAYEAAGEVLFDTASMPDYGQLSRRPLDEQQAGARVAVDQHKKSPGDFVLWKLSSPEEPGWESPWGRGRPGWHIECSAMSAAYLGEVFDIHGGGLDLIFPHHTNEIAQTEAYTGKPPFARIWMHNALLQLGSEKMSKSIGNLVTIEEALDQYGPDALRLFVITSHYRSPVTYSEEALEAAKSGAERLRKAAFATAGESGPELDAGLYRQRFIEAMEDDLNTPRALAAMFDLAREVNRAASAGQDVSGAQATLRELCGVLGLTLQSRAKPSQEAAPFIDLLIGLRTELRAAKQWAIADQVRDGLTALGVEIKDGPEGTTWSLK